MNSPLRRTLPCFILSLLIGLPTARGVVIANYDFTDSTIASDSIDTDPDSTASGLSFGTGLPQTGTVNMQSGISTITGNPGNSLYVRRTNELTETNVVTNNRYFTFTLTPNAGALSIDSVSFDVRRESATSGTALFIRTDAGGDGFSTNIATLTLTGTGTFLPSGTLNFTGVPALQNIASGTPVALRFYIYGGTDATSLVRLDNLLVNGTAVPEAHAGALALAGLIFIGLRRGSFARS